jgi:YD repeat-containing protein
MLKWKHGLGVSAVLASLSFLAVLPAHAENLTDLVPMVPRIDTTDENGVDIPSGVMRFDEPLIASGEGPTLSLSFPNPSPMLIGPDTIGQFIYSALSSNSSFGVSGTAPPSTLVLPHQTVNFVRIGYRQLQGNGTYVWPHNDSRLVTMTQSANQQQFDYQGYDGTTAKLLRGYATQNLGLYQETYAQTSEIKFPNGEIWNYYYNTGLTGAYPLRRVKSIVSSRGFALQFDYQSDSTSNLSNAAARDSWFTLVKVTRYNKAQYSCNEASLTSCAAVASHPDRILLSYNKPARQVSITKQNGETAVLNFVYDPFVPSLNGLSSVQRGNDPAATLNLTYEHIQDTSQSDENGNTIYGPEADTIATLSKDGRTWSYGFGFTGPNGQSTQGQSGTPDGASYIYNTEWTRAVDNRIETVDGVSRITFYKWSNVGQGYQPMPAGQYTDTGLVGVTDTENIDTTINYDGRANVTSIVWKAKPGTGLPDRAVSASFPVSCTNYFTCNKPTTVTDAKGNVTSFTYDPNHGGTLTETAPAVNGVTPQKRFEYAQRYAWVRNASGSFVQSATPIWVMTRERNCKTTAPSGASCAGGAADEVVTDYDYGPNSGPNNLLLRGVAVTATNSSGAFETQRTCYSYDEAGRKISETKPLANLASCP